MFGQHPDIGRLNLVQHLCFYVMGPEFSGSVCCACFKYICCLVTTHLRYAHRTTVRMRLRRMRLRTICSRLQKAVISCFVGRAAEASQFLCCTCFTS